MIWFVLIPAMISAVVKQLWSEWGFRIFVMVSLGANVSLGLLSRTRRRSASGWWAYVRVVGVSVLWFLYQVAEKVTTSAISNLTLSSSDVSDDEKQLVALWASFLLLHLGGPDNLTAYALEDNKLSERTLFEMIRDVLGVGYAIYNYTYGGGHSWFMLAASIIIFVAGIIRYGEKSYALSKANLDKMQEDASSASPGSSKKEIEECYRCRSTERKMDQLRYRIKRKQQCRLCDREALVLAQELFPVWRHAMVDSSVIPESGRQKAGEQILWMEWRSLCKVAEMELSLMYEVLYTKAIVAHTWSGCYYLIRFLSPLFTAAAALLFCLHQQQHGDQGIRGSFLWITCALLVVNFLLDLAWLLRALGSTWAYVYMQTQAPAWLRHQVICPGRWRRLHHFVIRVDPMSWLLRRDPVSYRTWSGTIGRYNLLLEATSRCPGCLDPKKETPYLSKLPPDVKKLLLQRVQKILQQAVQYDPKKDTYYAKNCYIMEDIRSKWGEKAFDLRNHNHHQRHLFPGLVHIHNDDEAPRFGKEFEEDVLAWHIATCIVLPYIRQQRYGGPLEEQSGAHAKAIAVMSEYMMFLVAVRREMLPGLVLHNLLEVTKKELAKIWRIFDNCIKGNMVEVRNEDKLAKMLRLIRLSSAKQEGDNIGASEGTTFVLDAVNLFASLTLAGDTPQDRERRKGAISSSGQRVKRRTPVPVPEMLELIFNVWVDKLVYAALRCSRESHARQLSAGGDLTTVLWMVIQHAGPFRMGELKAIYIPTRARLRRPEEKKQPQHKIPVEKSLDKPVETSEEPRVKMAEGEKVREKARDEKTGRGEPAGKPADKKPEKPVKKKPEKQMEKKPEEKKPPSAELPPSDEPPLCLLWDSDALDAEEYNTKIQYATL